MEELIASLGLMNLEHKEIQQKETPVAPRRVLVQTICHLYKENIDLKQELSRLRNLLRVVNEPRIPEWVR